MYVQVCDWLHFTKERNFKTCDALTRKTRKLVKCITVIEVSSNSVFVCMHVACYYARRVVQSVCIPYIMLTHILGI
jgi:hypothetical protein